MPREGLRGSSLGTVRVRGLQSSEASACPQHTRLGAPGLYIQTLLPGSPAAADGRLSLGDRILEVNGSSLLGLGYLRYPYRMHARPFLPDALLRGGDLG